MVVAGAPNAPKTVLDVALEPPNAEKQFQEDLLFNIAICKQCKFELNQTQNQVLRNVFIFFYTLPAQKQLQNIEPTDYLSFLLLLDGLP